MAKTKPYLIFVIGLLLVVVLSTVYYFTLPRFEYYGGVHAVYKPGKSLPETQINDLSVSNMYLLLKFTRFAIIYWAVFVIVYLIITTVKTLKFKERYVWAHFILASMGFSILLYLNPYVIKFVPQTSYMTDVFIAEFTKGQLLQSYQLMLWYSSVQVPTSIIGISMCLLSVLIFIIGLFRAWYTRSSGNAR
jgi:hypothetical protein